ncbi:hypothetical protein NLG97_g6879 [Lecanicillium saksenae]|uniref:Uncharacterized protein n=1 Tax=Lecanicillium saksenae TaxID=468837 RepID=A0ACC1QS71_9HYPO|nr:hypothetical protein NLG97_g6879 [Lecanicillium saksenae]
MAANRNRQMALSILSHCRPLARPRLHLLRPASQCRSYPTYRVQKETTATTHILPVGRAKRYDVESMLDFTAIPRSYVEAFISTCGDEFDIRSPAGYYDGLMVYAESIRSRGNAFTVIKPTDKLPDAVVLHDLGCIVAEASRGSMMGLAASLWFTAATWGYAPSTCSLAGFLAHTGMYGQSELFTPAEQRFQALVKQGRDPIAMAIQGEILCRQGSLAAAEDMLRKALRRHESKGELGNWEPNARISLGRTLAKRGKTDEAEAVLRKLSDEGYIEADGPLGKILRDKDPDLASQYMFRMGCVGFLDVFNDMAAIELDKSAKAENSRDAEEHRKWAEELSHLGNKKATF